MMLVPMATYTMISMVWGPRVCQTSVCTAFGARLRWAPASLWVARNLVKPMKYQQFGADPLLSIWRRCGGQRGDSSHASGRGIQECLIFSMDVDDSHVSGHVGFLPLLKCYDFQGFERIHVFHIDGTYIH